MTTLVKGVPKKRKKMVGKLVRYGEGNLSLRS